MANNKSKDLRPETVAAIEPQELKLTSNFILTINRFIELKNDHILSPLFNIGLNTKWYIKVKPSHEEHGKEYVSIHLYVCYCDELSIKAKYKVSIITSNNQKKNTKICDEINYEIGGDGWGYRKFIDRKQLIDNSSELMPNNKLSLSFQIEISDNQNNLIENNFMIELSKIKSYKNLSDFTFIVNGKEFFVHKVILSAHSPVFAAIFAKDMNENKLEICDIESNVFRELLSFIYTGKSTQVRTLAHKLLIAAEKYNIIQLKSICEDVVHSELNNENAIQTIILAEKCNASKLRERVIDYISDNLSPIRRNPGNEWKTFIEEYPNSVDKIFEILSQKSFENSSFEKKDFSINRWIYRKF